MKSIIIFSISSDIGFNLAKQLLKDDYNVHGTYRTYSSNLDELKRLGANLHECDLQSNEEIDKTILKIKKCVVCWDALYLCQATMNPIGKLDEVDINKWEDSVRLNFIGQVRIIQSLLPCRNRVKVPSVITFAGGGTNSAVKDFSAYTISKIALIKMMELLYEEFDDTKFVSIGPGWVKTKIHQETIDAKEIVPSTYEMTIKKFKDNTFTDMSKVIDCLLWIENSSKEEVSARNFSVSHDEWNTSALSNELKLNSDMYKLRRKGNEWKS